jgi:hypothetical protein
MPELPHEVPQPDDRADEEPDHHPESGERERADRAEESADVAAERQHGALVELVVDRELQVVAVGAPPVVRDAERRRNLLVTQALRDELFGRMKKGDIPPKG